MSFPGIRPPQSAWLIAISLVASFLVFDSYYSHLLLPLPNWYPSPSPPPTPSLSNVLPSAASSSSSPSSSSNSSNSSSASDSYKSRPPPQIAINQQTQVPARGIDHHATNSTAPSAHGTLQSSPSSATAPSLIKSTPQELLSLRRVEAGLRNARLALRKAALLEKNMTSTRALQAHDSSSSSAAAASAAADNNNYVPWGPLYRDASIFQQSYLEMEKRFRVFVYPEGEEPLVHSGPCKEIYSIEGRFIQELQASNNNPFVTDDPEKAHVFFLPFSVSMMVTYLYKPSTKDRAPMLHFARDYVEVVANKYPFWNRSQGADHFMLSCHDWGPYVSMAHPYLYKHAIRVLCNANSSEGFVPDKDASLPEINLVGGYIPAELGGPPMRERPHLAFFAGRSHGPVRPIVYKYWEGKDENVKVFQEVPKGYSYQDMMKKSKFCLCPGGYEVNSPRIVEAIYNDCIPVVIADKFVLPFNDVLNWDAFSLRVMEEDIPNLKRILQAVPQGTYEEMQERVRQVRRHFLLNQPPQRYDVFHMILHSIWLRRLNFRLNYS